MDILTIYRYIDVQQTHLMHVGRQENLLFFFFLGNATVDYAGIRALGPIRICLAMPLLHANALLFVLCAPRSS